MAVTERPILFSGPMVKALLEGRKTQTRRIMKSQPYTLRTEGFGYPTKAGGFVSIRSEHCLNECPYGQPGDRLWVRETWAVHEPYPSDDSDTADKLGLPMLPLSPELIPYWQKRVMFRAGFPDDVKPCDAIERGSADKLWRPSIHMPRWASRITLEVTEVRVQRLQEISEEDAIAEGLIPYRAGPFLAWKPFESYEGGIAPFAAYNALWESINGPGSWDANPWVWAVTFKREVK